MRKVFLALALLCLLGACDSGPPVPENSTETKVEVVEVVKESLPEVFDLEIVPEADRLKLGLECTGVEASFYYSGKSMSSKECGSFLKMLDGTPPTKISKNEVGHVTFIVDNEPYSLAKIILDPETNYMKFAINGAFYYHNLTESGIAFFQSMTDPTVAPE